MNLIPPHLTNPIPLNFLAPAAAALLNISISGTGGAAAAREVPDAAAAPEAAAAAAAAESAGPSSSSWIIFADAQNFGSHSATGEMYRDVAVQVAFASKLRNQFLQFLT
jgi:hypothetical protein